MGFLSICVSFLQKQLEVQCSMMGLDFIISHAFSSNMFLPLCTYKCQKSWHAIKCCQMHSKTVIFFFWCSYFSSTIWKLRHTDLHFKMPNQSIWKPESSIKSTAREPSLTWQTGVLTQITLPVCLNAGTPPWMRKELPWLCTTLSACIGNQELGHQSMAVNVLQITN